MSWIFTKLAFSLFAKQWKSIEESLLNVSMNHSTGFMFWLFKMTMKYLDFPGQLSCLSALRETPNLAKAFIALCHHLVIHSPIDWAGNWLNKSVDEELLRAEQQQGWKQVQVLWGLLRSEVKRSREGGLPYSHSSGQGLWLDTYLHLTCVILPGNQTKWNHPASHMPHNTL